MKHKLLTLFILVFALGTSSSSFAGSINYDAGLNQWTFSGLGYDGTGNYQYTGSGLGGNGTHTRIGNGVTTAGWSNGGWDYYNNTSEYTDFWRHVGTSWTVTGAIWSNSNGNNSDGAYSLNSSDTPILSTSIADGTILNGSFTVTSLNNYTIAYSASTEANVPDNGATLSLIGLAMGAMVGVRRKFGA